MFKKNNLKIINADCMDIMKDYPDDYFDLAIVDSPFGIGNFSPKNHYGNGQSKYNYNWNNETPSKLYFEELKRISKDRIIFGANYYNCFEEKGGAIIWYKDQKHPNMSQCEIASFSRYKKVDFFRYDWTNTDKYNELRKTNIHPCQKPITLYDWILKKYAKKTDKILDTHLGSGSSAISSFYYGCKEFVGIEINTEYYNKSIKRIQQETLQMKLL